MTRIEELVLKRNAIDAEIEAEYQKEREAAARGEAEAQFNLGMIYFKGHGVPENFAEAFNAFKLAAVQGKTQAQFYLGVMYEEGKAQRKVMPMQHIGLSYPPRRVTQKHSTDWALCWKVGWASNKTSKQQ